MKLPALPWGNRGRRPGEINLARRPFVNQRPVRRISVSMASAGLALLLVNLWLYVGYAAERRQNEGELRRIAGQIEQEGRRVVELRVTLAEADLGAQNALVVFLNQRIAERTFGWSVLFDRLSSLLPEDARLLSLTPRFGDDGRPGEPASSEIRLGLGGAARSSEAVLDLVDALFADPAFRDPDLHQETGLGGEVRFTLDVVYMPEVATTLADRAAAAAGEAEAAAGEAAGAPDGEAAR